VYFILLLSDQTRVPPTVERVQSQLADSICLETFPCVSALLERFYALLRQGKQVSLFLVSGRFLLDPLLTELRALHAATPSVPKLALPTITDRDLLNVAVQHAGVVQIVFPPFDDLSLRLSIENALRQHENQLHTDELLAALRTSRSQQTELEEFARGFRQREMALEAENRNLSRRASTDSLTGLHNHAYLKRRLELEVERSLRTNVPLGVLMIDVDHFRDYNNRFGHQTGDEVLRRVGRMISEHRRVNDVIARYGGEEFALLLINADRRIASNIAERLRFRVSVEPFSRVGGAKGTGLTISLGVASCPADGMEAETILQAADEALFVAKGAGRNRVCIAGNPPVVLEQPQQGRQPRTGWPGTVNST